MELTDQYNFSIFRPRNKHGRKNRNVILTMLAIWALAVFGFQLLLRVTEKPTPEPALAEFDKTWPLFLSGSSNNDEKALLLKSLILVAGKTIVKPDDLRTLKGAVTAVTFSMMPDSVTEGIKRMTSEAAEMRAQLASLRGEQYILLSNRVKDIYSNISGILEDYTGIRKGSLESVILAHSLTAETPVPDNISFNNLPGIMKLYLTHNRSELTDTVFLGFPFHYFYTAVFLLVLFVGLCIAYNILIEWRLKKEGITE